MKGLITNPLFWAFMHFLIGAISSSLVVFYVFDLGTFWETTNEGIFGFAVSEEGLICMCFGAVAGGAFFARNWMFDRAG